MISIYQTISRIMISIYQRIFAYHDFNLPEYIRVPWFQFTRWNSRTMISFYQRMFAYHDFNLPQDVCVQWVQLWHSRTTSSIYQRMFAYHDFNLPEDVCVPWFQFTRYVRVPWFQFTDMFAYHDSIYQMNSIMISIYQRISWFHFPEDVRVPWFHFPEDVRVPRFQFTGTMFAYTISIYRSSCVWYHFNLP